jgi:hypothetical protein
MLGLTSRHQIADLRLNLEKVLQMPVIRNHGMLRSPVHKVLVEQYKHERGNCRVYSLHFLYPHGRLVM